MFEKSHFVMLRSKRIVRFGIGGDVIIKYLALSVLNDGTKDVSLVKARAIITATNLKKQQMLKELQLQSVVDSTEKRNKAIPIKAGEEFEVFIPLDDLRLSSDVPLKGWITLIVLSAYGRYDFMWSYSIHEKHLDVKPLNVFFHLLLAPLIFTKYGRSKPKDDRLEI